jgi:hypothetical protein
MAVNLLSNAPCKATIGTLTTTDGAGNISNIDVSSGRYARAGNYTAAITVRQAGEILHTGTNAVASGAIFGGAIIINGVSIQLSNNLFESLIANINNMKAYTSVVAEDIMPAT